MEYFSKYEIAPLDGTPFFRPDEIKCIAEALSDLPRAIGGKSIPFISEDDYMTHTRGIIIQHLMKKILAKDDLALITRIQGALDEDLFRHNVYFVLETILQTEIEIRESAAENSVDPDFTPLDNYHLESFGFGENLVETATIDWRYPEMAGNDASVLSQSYMHMILTGLNGGTPIQPDVSQGHCYLLQLLIFFPENVFLENE